MGWKTRTEHEVVQLVCNRAENIGNLAHNTKVYVFETFALALIIRGSKQRAEL